MSEVLASLGIVPVQILLNIVGFLVLLALLRKFMFGPISTMLTARREQIAHDRQEAARLRAESEGRLAELSSRLDNIEAEVRDRMQAAEREAQAVREELLTEARADREKILDSGLAELRREREKLLVEIRDMVADLAIVAAGKIVEAELDVDAHRAMIDDIVEHGVR